MSAQYTSDPMTMPKALALILIVLFLTAGLASAQSEPLPPLDLNRQVISMPKIKVPDAALQTGLGGVVRVLVTVDAKGKVVATSQATGPGSVCSQVSRADVSALRNAAMDAARNVKFAPIGENGPPLARTWVNIEFPGRDALPEFASSDHGPAGSAETSDEKKPRDPNKFTVKGDVNYSAANVPPPDYTGPVAVSKVSPEPGPDKTPTLSADKPQNTSLGKATETKTLSGGVLNGKARTLVRPTYPPAAYAVRAAGAVSVHVLIAESGDIFAARAVSGHPLLRRSAVTAACGSGFAPTFLSGNPVKVSGIIIYNFVP